MSTTIKKWYDFVLQQMAAESYLDQATTSPFGLTGILMLGSNNPAYLQDNKVPLPTTDILNGATRMTATQAADFTNRYTIVDHRSDDDPRFTYADSIVTDIGDGTGFSATLMLDNQTGEYTLSMRSTEYFNQTAGGDWARDGLDGADGEINSYGYALGQIVAMEDYYSYLKTTKLLPDGATLNVTGYSLSGSLATVFTELHSSEIAHTYAFNSPGHGTFDTTQGSLAVVIAYFQKALGDALTADFEATPPGLWQPLSTTNVYQDPRYLNALEATKQHFNLVGNSLSGYYNNLVGDGPVVSNGQITQIVGMGSNGDTALVANAQTHPDPTNIFIEDQPDIQGLLTANWAARLLGIKNNDFGTTHSITLLADSLAVMSTFEKLGLDMSTSAGLTSMYNILKAESNQSATGILGRAGTAEGDSLEKAAQALGKLMLGEAGLAAVLNGSTDITYSRTGGGFSNLTNRDDLYKVLNAVNAAANCFSGPLYVIDITSTYNAAQIATIATGNIAYAYALVNLCPFALVGNDAVFAQHNTHGELNLYNADTGQGLTTDYLSDRAAMLGVLIARNTADAHYAATDVLYSDAASHTTLLSSSENPEYTFRQIRFGSDTNTGTETLGGGNLADRLYGMGGNDILNGGGDNDTLIGGRGDDQLKGGTGADTYIYLKGDGKDNHFTFTDATTGATTTLTLDQFIAQAHSTTATAAGNGGDILFGAGGASLTGGAGNDTIYGWNGGNTLTAGTGDQILISESGHDLLQGGAGNDTLVSAAGYDTMRGGTGNTTFEVNSTSDVIEARSTGGAAGDAANDTRYESERRVA